MDMPLILSSLRPLSRIIMVNSSASTDKTISLSFSPTMQQGSVMAEHECAIDSAFALKQPCTHWQNF